MGAVVVTKSPLVVVRPPEPVTAAGNISLSPHDKNVMCVPVTMFLVFDHPIGEPAETVKSALSQALVHYLPISGRLAAGAEQGEVRIACTGEGVSFVAAAADCALKDVKFFDRSAVLVTGSGTLLDELAVFYPAEVCGLSDPLLLMQVTEFSCGGFVLGVTWNHVIADAAGIGQFLQAVGELARGLPSPSVPPVRRDDTLTGVPPSSDGFMELMMSLRPVDMAILDITVPSSSIDRIKDAYRRVRSSNGGWPCTTFEAVTAVLWQCRTRAIAPSPEDPVALYFTVNARKYLGARDGYYGNCLTGRLVMARADAVANGDLVDVVEMIRRAKSKIPGQFNKGTASDGDVEEHVGGLAGYNLLIVTCWRNLGLEEVDFGGGRPARVTSYTQQRVSAPACLPCLPCRGNDGANVLSGCVREEHAAAFLEELASRFN